MACPTEEPERQAANPSYPYRHGSVEVIKTRSPSAYGILQTFRTLPGDYQDQCGNIGRFRGDPPESGANQQPSGSPSVALAKQEPKANGHLEAAIVVAATDRSGKVGHQVVAGADTD